MTKNKRIGLVLSGGGIRAMAFHAGVIRYMAEQDELEQVTCLSTVSGGSLVVGLIMQLSGGKWPSSEYYLTHVSTRLKSLLTRQQRQPLTNVFSRLFLGDIEGAKTSLRQNFPMQDIILTTISYILRKPWLFRERLHLLAKAYQNCWGVNSTLGELSPKPEWRINATSAEYGVRFNFKHNVMGDYKSGYSLCKDMLLAEAMAVSSAVPGVFGPYRLHTRKGEWFEWSSNILNDIESNMATPKELEFDWLELYDGGVYDNLGLEPFFDCGTQLIKKDIDISHLVVSDAGKPLGSRHLGDKLQPVMRIYDIASNQSRSLRIRALINFFKQDSTRGRYLMIGTNPYECIRQNRSLHTCDAFILSKEDREAAAAYPTHLSCMLLDDFRRIEQHGYETALANSLAFS
ncbi:patatin-like phospholipase family protein [Aeromonas veronii]|uniref:patatin-like phospholipase family protein n=1 Tax=Aeromonas veronii TaxID=654 RepID=UPI0011168502|nr:patatin-like phospholipase family protein [Aeromonas veronii]